MSSIDKFLSWERASRDTIDFKKIYVDMAGGDVVAGLALSEIVYWYLPSKDGGTKLRIEQEGKLWIAVRRYEWWDRARLTPDQADRVINALVKCGLVERKVFKFNRDPTTHVRIIEDRFIDLWVKLINTPAKNPFIPVSKQIKAENPFSPNGDNAGENEIPFSPNGENQGSRQTAITNSPNGENELAKRREPLTESTAKTTAQITTENNNMGASAPEKPEPQKTIIKNQKVFEALAENERRKAAGEFDLSAYPEDVRGILGAFCDIWKIKPPAKIGGKGGEFALWITEGRQLADACGEFGNKALKEAFGTWQADPKRTSISRPRSIIYLVNDRAASLRRNAALTPMIYEVSPNQDDQQADETDDPVVEVDQAAREAWMMIEGQLKLQMENSVNYIQYVSRIRPVGLEGDILRVMVESAFARDWCQSRLTSTVGKLLTGIMGREMRVEFQGQGLLS